MECGIGHSFIPHSCYMAKAKKEVHLPNPINQLQAEITAVDFVGTVGDVIGIVGVVVFLVPVEDVEGIKEEGKAIVEEVGAETEVDAVGSLMGGEKRLGRRVVIGRGMQLKFVPKLHPSTEAHRIGPHVAANQAVLGLVVIGLDVRVKDLGFQPDVESGAGSVSDVELSACLIVFVEVDGHGIRYHTVP